MNEKEITIQGKTYPSIKAAASAYGLTSSAIIARRKAGWTDEDYERGHRETTPSGTIPTTINGIEYPSRLSCDKAHVEDIWHEWCCNEKECPHTAESEEQAEEGE